MLLIDTKKHLVWHTLADFWNELGSELEKQQYAVTSPVKLDDITKVAHEKRGMQKNNILMKMTFKKDNVCLEIIQESKKPLYWINNGEEIQFSNEIHLDDITAYRDSCYLMNEQYRHDIVKIMVKEIVDKILRL